MRWLVVASLVCTACGEVPCTREGTYEFYGVSEACGPMEGTFEITAPKTATLTMADGGVRFCDQTAASDDRKAPIAVCQLTWVCRCVNCLNWTLSVQYAPEGQLIPAGSLVSRDCGGGSWSAWRSTP